MGAFVTLKKIGSQIWSEKSRVQKREEAAWSLLFLNNKGASINDV
jgi:hypothetical protein